MSNSSNPNYDSNFDDGEADEFDPAEQLNDYPAEYYQSNNAAYTIPGLSSFNNNLGSIPSIPAAIQTNPIQPNDHSMETEGETERAEGEPESNNTKTNSSTIIRFPTSTVEISYQSSPPPDSSGISSNFSEIVDFLQYCHRRITSEYLIPERASIDQNFANWAELLIETTHALQLDSNLLIDVVKQPFYLQLRSKFETEYNKSKAATSAQTSTVQSQNVVTSSSTPASLPIPTQSPPSSVPVQKPRIVSIQPQSLNVSADSRKVSPISKSNSPNSASSDSNNNGINRGNTVNSMSTPNTSNNSVSNSISTTSAATIRRIPKKGEISQADLKQIEQNKLNREQQQVELKSKQIIEQQTQLQLKKNQSIREILARAEHTADPSIFLSTHFITNFPTSAIQLGRAWLLEVKTELLLNWLASDPSNNKLLLNTLKTLFILSVYLPAESYKVLSENDELIAIIIKARANSDIEIKPWAIKLHERYGQFLGELAEQNKTTEFTRQTKLYDYKQVNTVPNNTPSSGTITTDVSTSRSVSTPTDSNVQRSQQPVSSINTPNTNVSNSNKIIAPGTVTSPASVASSAPKSFGSIPKVQPQNKHNTIGSAHSATLNVPTSTTANSNSNNNSKSINTETSKNSNKVNFNSHSNSLPRKPVANNDSNSKTSSSFSANNNTNDSSNRNISTSNSSIGKEKQSLTQRDVGRQTQREKDKNNNSYRDDRKHKEASERDRSPDRYNHNKNQNSNNSYSDRGRERDYRHPTPSSPGNSYYPNPGSAVPFGYNSYVPMRSPPPPPSSYFPNSYPAYGSQFRR